MNYDNGVLVERFAAVRDNATGVVTIRVQDAQCESPN